MNDGWTATTLGDLATLVKGISYRSSELCEVGGSPFINLKNVERNGGYRRGGLKRYLGEGKPEQRANPGDVLIALTDLTRDMAVVGSPVVVPDDPDLIGSWFSLDLARIVPKESDVVLLPFLARLLEAPPARDFMKRVTSGTTVMHLNTKAALGMPLSLPPIQEQRRIIDLISSIDAAITKCDFVLGKCETALDAVLSETLDFSGEHPLMNVGDLAITKGLVGGPFGSSLVRKDYTEDGIPVIRGTNMTGNGRWVGGDFAFVSEDKAGELAKNIAVPGDVVFTQRGTLGQVALVPAEPYDRYVVSQSQMRLRPNRDVVSPDYVYWCFRSPRMVSHVQSLNTATANPHINLGILAAIEIPVPDKTAQGHLVMLCDAIDESVHFARRQLESLQELRQSVLHSLLSGTHEIPDSYNRFLEEAS